jgi:hypothetical protein
MTKTSKILELHGKGLTNLEISKNLNITVKSIQVCLAKKQIKCNRYKIIEEKYIFDLEQFIIGSMLGDGYLTKRDNNKTSIISISHSPKQKTYIEWKYKFLNNLDLVNPLYFYKQKDIRFKLGYSECFTLKSKTHPIFNQYRDIFYINNKKVLPLEMINKIDELAIAIWFYDDSAKCQSSYQIQTTCFTKKEVNNLIIHLEKKFDIHSTFQPHRNILYIRKNSIEKLNKIVLKLNIKELFYKVHIKQDELSGKPCEGNQQPSLDSNIFEGSTTNSQIQTSSVEDSNANTSVLPFKIDSDGFTRTILDDGQIVDWIPIKGIDY